MIETKEKDAQQYNKRFGTQELTFKVGDEVVIKDRNFWSKDQFITAPRFHGSYIISDIVANDEFGKSYRLVRSTDGKPLKNLISFSRLRLYTAGEREHFHAKYPKLLVTVKQKTDIPVSQDASIRPATGGPELQVNDKPKESEVKKKPNFEPALKILKERRRNGKKELYVLFRNRDLGAT